MEIKKSTNVATDIDDNLITVNNFSVHLVKEINSNILTLQSLPILRHYAKTPP